MTNTDFVRRYMGYVGENSTATRYNTRWESTANTTYSNGVWATRQSSRSNLDDMYKLLLEYERVYRDTTYTGRAQPKPAKLPDSYPKGDINSLLGLEEDA